jgi:hypothetical protein
MIRIRQFLVVGILAALGGSAACGGDDSSSSGTPGAIYTSDASSDASPGSDDSSSSSCADTQTDPHNCGACGNDCGSPNQATATCVSGRCVLTCAVGFGDCNFSYDDGCETDLTQTATSCGKCGVSCLSANATAACVASKCTTATCNVGFADCNQDPSDGCEVDLNNDPRNCSTCGHSCPTLTNQQATCSAGVCGNGDCVSGFAVCGGNAANGCQINLLTDKANCGACGTTCGALPNAVSTCTAGGCAIDSCSTGWHDCNHSMFDGCEAQLDTDPNNCSACGTKCPAVAHGTPGCTAGVCGIGACDVGYADCNGNPADGCEVNLATDGMNCGVCNNVCPAVANGAPACSGYACGIGSCTGTFQHCVGNGANGCETDTSNSVDHCGSCANSCPAVANGTRACSNSACGIGSCSTGFADCNGNAGDGCEVHTTSDVNNCGGCGAAFVCATPPNGNPSCVNSVCGLGTCATGYSNCDGNAANGCEKNTTNDAANCGGCGIVCGSGSCVNSACVCSKQVLLIADDSSTGTATLATALTAAGYTVTQTGVAAEAFVGPVPAGTGAIVLLAGTSTGATNSASTDMPPAGQTAILNFANAGNGVVFTEWAAEQVSNGRWATLAPLVLLQRSGAQAGQVDYNLNPAFAGHPVWAGLPTTGMTLSGSSNVGFAKTGPGINSLATSTFTGGDVVAIRDLPGGRVVHIGFSGNFQSGGWAQTNAQTLVANAAGWVARCN